MRVKTKRRLTFICVGIFNFLCGVEYGVVFPTLWGYIRERFNAQSYMLGIIISAFSFSGLFSNPVIGLWADYSQNTKFILLVTNIGEIVGSFMYFLGISSWFLVFSRLIAGIGSGAGAAVFADITRSTSEEERTPIISSVVLCRQIGLLFGPAMNFFLRKFDFYIGSFPLDRYTSPGLFMACLWLVMEFIFLIMYHNLTTLTHEEDIEEQLYYNQETESNDCYSVSAKHRITRSVSLSSSPPLAPFLDTLYSGYDDIVGFGDKVEEVEGSREEQNTNELCKNSEPSSSFTDMQRQAVTGENYIDSTTNEEIINKNKVTNAEPGQNTSDLMIESAEQFIISHSCSVLETDTKPLTSSIREDAAPQGSGNIQTQSSSHDVHHSRHLIKGKTKGILRTQSNTSSVSLINPTRQNIYLDEYVRDEVVVLLGMAFISSFCQTTLETVITPLTQELYNFGELENSIIYFVAGVEIILVFVVIRIISKRFSDRSMLLMGVSILCLALGWSLASLPTAKPTLSQGLRRTMVSLGCIIGPLWGGAELEPRFRYVLFAVPFSVCFLITIMLLGSYHRLKSTNISSNCADHDTVDQNDGETADTCSLLSNA
ncbi:uncharacterized protein LOC143229664 isoform X2 [Tachypleus tridentatus]|uniref:uncharacterized protein LOC143229664 isoform X2 n=1 Tax=Tachypleus tridentatus TaxID=6853 RepID=UPI003FD25594